MDKLIIKTKRKTIVINVADILYCQASGSYSEIILKDLTNITASINLSNINRQLAHIAYMYRASQSYLVNLLHISTIHHDTKEIEFTNKHRVPFTVNIKSINDKLYLVNNSRPKNNIKSNTKEDS